MPDIRVLIVEDEPIIAADIAEFLESNDYGIVGKAYECYRALELLDLRMTDIVLLDINLDCEMDGIELAKIINEKYQIPFVFLTSYADKDTISRAKHTMPAGYIVKPFDEKELFATIEIAIFKHNQRNAPLLDLANIKLSLGELLTEKECDILWDIYQGKSNKRMAELHFISLNTVKSHVKKIYDKLDVHSRSEAIVKLHNLV